MVHLIAAGRGLRSRLNGVRVHMRGGVGKREGDDGEIQVKQVLLRTVLETVNRYVVSEDEGQGFVVRIFIQYCTYSTINRVDHV